MLFKWDVTTLNHELTINIKWDIKYNETTHVISLTIKHNLIIDNIIIIELFCIYISLQKFMVSPKWKENTLRTL